MNTIRIAVKELKVFRDVKMLIFMLATPVLLMLILGTALSNAFHGSADVGQIRVLYQNDGIGGLVAQQWEAFIRDAGASGVRFEKADHRSAGLAEVKRGDSVGFAAVTDRGIEYAGNSRSPIENSIVHGMLTAFADRYKLAAVLNDPDLISGGTGSYVEEASVLAAKQPGALDYYAVAVTTMIILYSALTAGLLMDNERKRHTDIRLLAAPVAKMEIFTGKILGTLLLNAGFTVIIVFFSKYMFGAYWGDQLVPVFAVLLSQIVYALGLGIGISYIVRGKAAGTVIMLIIQLESFIGGGYFPVKDLSGFLGAVSQYSPLRVTNDAILQVIYAGDTLAAVPAALFNLGSAALLLAAAVFAMRRREGL